MAVLALALALGRSAAAADPKLEVIFTRQAGLGRDWKDYGWAPGRQYEAGAPVTLDLSNNGGWIVARPDLPGNWGTLSFRMKAPPAYGNFLEVRVDSRRPEMFPRVRLKKEFLQPLTDGWVQVKIPIPVLDPARSPFDQVVFRAADAIGSAPVLLDEILLVEEDPGALPLAVPGVRPRPAQVTVDCASKGKGISPLVYGVGSSGKPGVQPAPWELGATARRWGGNPSSRFNWEIGHAWNGGSDDFFRNVNFTGNPGDAFAAFLRENKAHGMETALTVPTLGWVAKDTTSYAFPVALLGKQQATSPDNPDIGNGIKPDGEPIQPGPLTQTRTSVAAAPAFVGRWVKSLAAGRSVRMYILDNEPSLWNSSHRDVHPAPLTYDELLTRTVNFAREVRKGDPDALIAGPADSGWPSMFFSAADFEGTAGKRPDRQAHGGLPLLPWWLRELSRAEKRLGIRLVDVVDVHWTPQFEGAGMGTRGDTDPASSARRIRSVHSLWDPNYVEESWINEKVELLPRLRRWIAENHPDRPMAVSLGEWNWGAEGHLSGGLATAATLGVLGREGALSAFYWTVPPLDSPSYWAFRAFRNFDGKGGRFEDLSQPAEVQGTLLEAFASRSAAGDRVVAVLLNEDPAGAAEVTLDASSCGPIQERRIFVYLGKPAGFEEVRAAAAPPLKQILPPYSISVVELRIAAPR